jgi:hypothetical protein
MTMRRINGAIEAMNTHILVNPVNADPYQQTLCLSSEASYPLFISPYLEIRSIHFWFRFYLSI